MYSWRSCSVVYTLQMKGRWGSNINFWFPFMYSQKWNCYLFCFVICERYWKEYINGIFLAVEGRKLNWIGVMVEQDYSVYTIVKSRPVQCASLIISVHNWSLLLKSESNLRSRTILFFITTLLPQFSALRDEADPYCACGWFATFSQHKLTGRRPPPPSPPPNPAYSVDQGEKQLNPGHCWL